MAMGNSGFDREKIARTLYSAVLSDVMDGLGLMNQAMRPFVRPLDDALVLFGRARTGLYMPRYGVAPGEDPYEIEIALIDDLKPGDVAVLACDGPTTRIAPWGELLSTASVARGAAGCVTDGLVRDVRRIPRRRGGGRGSERAVPRYASAAVCAGGLFWRLRVVPAAVPRQEPCSAGRLQRRWGHEHHW